MAIDSESVNILCLSPLILLVLDLCLNTCGKHLSTFYGSYPQIEQLAMWASWHCGLVTINWGVHKKLHTE
jgi:hypothetical protein